MGFDRKFLLWALAYVLIGMALGIVMAASHDHGQRSAHSHILLVGFATSFIYAVIHRLWLNGPGRALATAQFVVHQAGAAVLLAALLLLYGGAVAGPTIEPVLAIASITVLVGALLMVYMVLKARPATA